MKKIVVALLATAMVCGLVYASDQDAAKALVESAVAFVNAQGKDNAITEFSKPQGMFDKGELYVFAYDLQGIVVAHPRNPKLIGKNLLDVPDNDGVFFRKKIVELATTTGSGWVDYKYLNPETKKPEPKTTFIQKAGDIIVCCGTYK